MTHSDNRKVTLSIIDAYKRAGMNQTDVATDYGVSRQAVSKVRTKYGPGIRTPREVAQDTWPWKVPASLAQNSPHKRMRDHAEYMATGGVGMAPYKLDRLRSFYNRLQSQNEVVEFDPNLPPSEGIKTGGWAYQQRRSSDGDLIIRVNQFTELSDVGHLIYRFPPVLP